MSSKAPVDYPVLVTAAVERIENSDSRSLGKLKMDKAGFEQQLTTLVQSFEDTTGLTCTYVTVMHTGNGRARVTACVGLP